MTGTVPTCLSADGWCFVRSASGSAAAQQRRAPALFLDRDGVVIEDTGYPSDPAAVRLMSGAATAIARFNRAGVPVVVVTNQSGIGRGYFGWEVFTAVQDEVERLLAVEGARIDLALACGYFGEAGHPWRKPEPGMVVEAARLLDLDRGRSWIVGDRPGDLEAGRKAGLGGGVLLLVPERSHGRLPPPQPSPAHAGEGASTSSVVSTSTSRCTASLTPSPARAGEAASRKRCRGGGGAAFETWTASSLAVAADRLLAALRI